MPRTPLAPELLHRRLRERRFYVWAVDTAEEAAELLTGLPFGAPDAQGRYPADTLGARVADRLAALSETARSFANEPAGRLPSGERP